MFKSLIKKNYLLLLATFLVLALYWIKTNTYLDPDFGYRLRNGQIILKEGIEGIRTDPYSYTMPGFEFVEHSWMSAVVIALTFSATGMGGVTFLFSIVALSSLAVSTATINPKKSLAKISKKVFGRDIWHFGNPIFLLSLAIILGFVGVRVQVMSWIFLSTLFLLVFNDKRWEKYKYFVPVLFLFWANLHASFFEGMIVLLTILFFKAFNFNYLLEKESYKNIKLLAAKLSGSIKKVKLPVGNLIILVASFLATLINPYGIGAWKKVLMVASSSSLRWNINEWMPAFTSFDLALVVYVATSVMFVTRYLNKFKVEQVFLYFFILIQGLFGVRHVPLWIIISYPMTTEAIYYFWKEVGTRGKSEALFNKAFKMFWVVVVAVCVINTTVNLYGAYGLSEENYYPKKAVEMLKDDLPEGRIFSTYGWGGYLTWKLPEKKIFVSGLMPIWEYKITPEGELKYAYQTYLKILSGEEDYRLVFKKFGIDTVLWNPSLSGGGGMIDKLLGSTLLKSGLIAPAFDLGRTLETNGWTTVYEDGKSVIYKRQE
jgi:hypothetical protein